jgi:hypothetical protein
MPIVLLTNDVDNRQKAAAEGIKAMSVLVRICEAEQTDTAWCGYRNQLP